MVFMVPGLVFMIPGGVLPSLMVPGWFKSELSAIGAKWDVENTSKGTPLICILAQLMIIMIVMLRTPQVPSKVRYQKTKPNCICFPQFFNHIFLHMSRTYVSVFNEEYVLDQWEAFSHGCMVAISFHFMPQSSEFYWPFGLVFWSHSFSSIWREPLVA